MRLTAILNGLRFGTLAKVHGIVTWKISPFEQRAFPDFFTKTMPNTFRRIRSNVPYIIPPFMIGYFVFEYNERRHAELQRKDPAQFENDE